MKKPIILLVVVLLSLLMGCNKGEMKVEGNEVEVFIGYIVIEDNILYFDEVEIVKVEDKKRMKELDIDESDMPNGYAIINEIQEEITFELAEEVEYKFTDVNLNFVEESEIDGDRLYSTIKKDEFFKHLGDLRDIPLSKQTIPYFIGIQDGKVISVEEKLIYTI